jgi:hypothetical protein
MRQVSSTSSSCTRRPSSAWTLTIGPSRKRAMSTECVPLSISTPPPPCARLEFQRVRMSTLLQNTFSNRITSPSIPESTIPLALITSST